MNDSPTFIKVGNSYSVLDRTVTFIWNLNILNHLKHLWKFGNEYWFRALTKVLNECWLKVKSKIAFDMQMLDWLIIFFVE